MKKITARQFKAECLTTVDWVHRTGKSVVITKNGKPVAQLTAAPCGLDDVFGYMAGKVKIVGDIVSPISP